MGLGNIFGRQKSSNTMNAMMAVQKMKNLGTTEMLSMSQIVNLITNLPDAQRNLDDDHFRFVYAVFKIYRKQRDLRPMNTEDYIRACKLIIDTYEDEVPYLLLDGKYSENLSEQAIADVWFLYNSGMRCDEMLPLAERGKMGAFAEQMCRVDKEPNASVNNFPATRKQNLSISYCHKCGNKLVDGSVFCNRCGTKIPCTEDAQRG